MTGVQTCALPICRRKGVPAPARGGGTSGVWKRNELEIVGSRANGKQELAETMELVARGRIKPIVDRVIPLADIEEAFAALREGRPLGRNVLAI